MTLLQANCSQQTTKKKALAVYESYLDTVKTSEAYRELRTAFADTMKNWIGRDLSRLGMFEFGSTLILDSAVFFNSDKTRALILILKKRPENLQSTHQHVDILGSEKIDERWHFYYMGFWSMVFSKESGVEYSDEYFFDKARQKILEGGFIDNKTKSINYSYVDNPIWFNDETRQKHIGFLERKWDRRK